MTDGEKPRQRKKVPTLQELDDMPEGGTGQPASPGKSDPTGSKANRRRIRVREGVGRNKKVAKAPTARPEPKPASKPEKVETVAEQSAGKPPEPGVGQSLRIPTRDQEAQDLASQKAEKRKHQLGPFKRSVGVGGRKRIYESKCVKCSRRAIAQVVFYEDYPDHLSDIRASGSATEETCSKTRRNPITKTEAKSRPKPKSENQVKLPAAFEVPLPSWDGILEATAQDEARRAANDRDRRHRVKVLFPISYPKAGKDSIYQGKCERCRRKVFGKVQRFPDEPGKSERILVYGDALQHRCSGARAKR